MAAEIPVQKKSYYIHAAVILCFMIFFRFLPPFGPVTEYGMAVLGIFIGLIYAWIVGQIVWPSLVALLLLSFVGDATLTGVVQSAFGNSTLMMVVFSLVFCYAIQISGVLPIFARWLISRKFARRGPWWLAFAFFATAAGTSILVLNTIPVVLLLWEVFYDVCKQLNIKPYSKYATIVMVGIVIAGYAGGITLPLNGVFLTGYGVLQKIDPTVVVNFGSYIGMAFLVTVGIVLGLTAIFKLLGPKDLEWGELEIPDAKLDFTTRQKLTLGWIVILVLTMVLPNFLPSEWIFVQWMNHLTSIGVMILIPTVMMMTTYKGQQFVDIAKGMSHGVTWELYFLLAAALYIAGLIASDKTGISTLLTDLVAPLLSGHSVIVTAAIIITMAIIITNCINNIVTVTLLTPIAYTFITAAGGDPVVIISLLSYVCLQGVVMPSGSVCGALLHGNVNWLKAGDIYKWATIGEIVVVISAVFIGVPVSMLLF